MPQSEGNEPHMPSLLQQRPNATLQVKSFGPPQVPSVVFPVTQAGGPGGVFGAGTLQLPSWQTPYPQ